jgi:hypothetical protein
VDLKFGIDVVSYSLQVNLILMDELKFIKFVKFSRIKEISAK